MPQVNKKELARAIAEKTGISAAKLEKALDMMVSEVEGALAAGDEVNIAGFLKLYADDMPPKSSVDPRTGRRMVIPVRRTVKAKMSKAFRERVVAANKVKGVGLVIAKEPEEKFAVELEKALAPSGVKCVVERDLKKAIRLLGGRAKSADFVVITPSVPETEYEQAIIEIKSRKATAFLPVLRSAFDVSRYEKPEGFKILPDHIFSSPLEVVRQVSGDLERWHEEKHYFKRQFKLRSSSKLDTVQALFRAFDTLAGRILSGADENYKLLSALHEAIENAAQHGNGGVADKYVTVEWIEDARTVMITVKDEGEGFNHEEALSAARLGSPDAVRQHMERGAGTGGLGIKLMLEVFDELEYFDGGRTMRATKKKT
ncbi:MAG TPA: hypothetical protein ENN09_01185 [Planctomycetes bacterium]|nr:hypothetical protein [Planctomycetota bacterium]